MKSKTSSKTRRIFSNIRPLHLARVSRSIAKSYKSKVKPEHVVVYSNPHILPSQIQPKDWTQLKRKIMKSVNNQTLCGDAGGASIPKRYNDILSSRSARSASVGSRSSARSNRTWNPLNSSLMSNSNQNNNINSSPQKETVLESAINPGYIQNKLNSDNIYAISCALDHNKNIVGFQTLHHYKNNVIMLAAGCVDYFRRGGTFGGYNYRLTRASIEWARSTGYTTMVLEGLPDAEESWKRTGFHRILKKTLNKYVTLVSKKNGTKTKALKDKMHAIYKAEINTYNPKKCSNPNGCWMLKNLS
jgi:hypothetical protein